MPEQKPKHGGLRTTARVDPAQPLWRLAPTRAGDGRCLADFMMLIPGLACRQDLLREQVLVAIREVCESYGDKVVFADLNLAINVLWISVAAEPGLAGRVAQSIRGRVPDALLVGGQLGAVTLPAVVRTTRRGSLWLHLRRLSRQALRLGPPAS